MFDRLIDLILSSLQAFLFFTIIDVYEKGVILRLGRYHRTIEPGFHFIAPFFVDRVLTDTVVPTTKVLGTQSLTTQDGVSVVLEAVVTYRTHDIRRLLLEVENAESAMRDACYGVISRAVTYAQWDDLRTAAFVDQLTKDVRKRAFKFGIEVQDVQLGDLARSRSIRLWQA